MSYATMRSLDNRISTPKHQSSWTATEEQRMQNLFRAGLNATDVAVHLGRTPQAVANRRHSVRKANKPAPSCNNSGATSTGRCLHCFSKH